MRHYESEQLIEDGLSRIADMQAELLTLRGIQEERDALRGECGVLREALEIVKTAIFRSKECNATWLAGEALHVQAIEKALASSPRSALVGEVVRTSVQMRRNQIEGQKFVTTATYGGDQPEWQRRAQECVNGINEWERAVDALNAPEGDRERARED